MPKIDFKAIDFKKLAILHCEKAVLALFVCCLGYFAYQTSNMTYYERTPKQLQEGANAVSLRVSESKLQEALQDPAVEFPQKPLKKFDLLALEGLKAPNPDDYRHSLWMSSVIPPKAKRGAPQVYPAEQLISSRGYGAFVLVNQGKAVAVEVDDPAGKGPARVVRTARAKGAATILTKLNEKNNPKKATNPRRPIPQGEEADPTFLADQSAIFDGGVEGANVTKGAKIEGRRWVALTAAVPFFKQQEEFFRALNSNPANLRETDFVRYIGARIQRAELKPGQTLESDDLKWELVPLNNLKNEIDSWDSMGIDPVDPALVRSELCLPVPPRVEGWQRTEVGHPLIPTIDQQKLREIIEETIKSDEAEVNKVGDGAPEGVFVLRRETQRPQVEQPKKENPVDKKREYYLFRFFDFTVQPGKTYTYRIQLLVKNPNFEVGEKDLVDPASAQKEYFETAWTSPSKPQTIDRDSNLLVGPAKSGPAFREHVDGFVQLLVRQWDHKLGVNAAKKFDAARGQLVNFPESKTTVIDPITGKPVEKLVTFRTDLMLLDFTGGKNLRHRLKDGIEPAEMLFVTPDGSLLVRSELDDRDTFRREDQMLGDLGGAVRVKPEYDPFAPRPPSFDPVPGTGIDPLGPSTPSRR